MILLKNVKDNTGVLTNSIWVGANNTVTLVTVDGSPSAAVTFGITEYESMHTRSYVKTQQNARGGWYNNLMHGLNDPVRNGVPQDPYDMYYIPLLK
ncbi:MAG: hypothetical protein LBT06_13425 [Hungatella sp.]|jgi:hypothetical protein|nr:hypothetical protein [Hungatella sp.]